MNLLTLVPLPYRLLGLALLAVALFGYGWIKGANHGEAKLQAFAESVRAEGIKAQAMADARIASDRQRKEASDASYSKALIALGADLERMRNARSSANNLPSTPADSKCPDGWACFDRPQLEQAIRRFDAGVSGIVGEGDQIALRLETAIRWANP